MEIVVAALNGFWGNRVGFDVTDMVNPRAKIAGLEHYTTRRGRPARGGAGYFAKRRFRRWVKKHAKRGDTFLFVGKSYGAHWILDIYDEFCIGHHAQALLFDPANTLKRGERHKRVVDMPEGITVVRQLGHRSGYRVHGATDIVIEARHSDIERTRRGKAILSDWLHCRNI